MSLTKAYKALRRLHQPVSLVSQTSGSYVRGEWVPGTPEPSVDVRLASLPLTPKQVQLLPEGQYTTQDRYFYQIGNEVSIQKYDKIRFGNETFVVQEVSDRMFDGGFYRYLGKKEVA
jgi:hypothetical protein